MDWVMDTSLRVLDRPAWPLGGVGRETLDGGERSLGPPVTDGVGDLAAAAGRVEGIKRAGCRRPDGGAEGDVDQVGEVGDEPVLAGLDEPVGVELGDVRLERGDLIADHAEQGLQRAADLGVAELVEGGQEAEGVVGHQRTTCWRMRVSVTASDR